MVGGEKTSLGGEYVGGEIVPWWRVCLVASLLGGEVTGNHRGCKHKENDLKGSENCFELWRVLVTEGKFAVKCKTEIQGKSILVRVSVGVGVELAPQSEIELNRTSSAIE